MSDENRRMNTLNVIEARPHQGKTYRFLKELISYIRANPQGRALVYSTETNIDTLVAFIAIELGTTSEKLLSTLEERGFFLTLRYITLWEPSDFCEALKGEVREYDWIGIDNVTEYQNLAAYLTEKPGDADVWVTKTRMEKQKDAPLEKSREYRLLEESLGVGKTHGHVRLGKYVILKFDPQTFASDGFRRDYFNLWTCPEKTK
jgi:hypothetical protein